MCFIHIMSTVLQTGYLPSFDRKLEGGKRVRPPPNPPTQAGQRARHLRSSRRPVYVCGGGGSARHGGRGWDARQIFATYRDDP